jgi:hypothetical protein
VAGVQILKRVCLATAEDLSEMLALLGTTMTVISLLFLCSLTKSIYIGPCRNLTTCEGCSVDTRCGWCAETQTCSRGNLTQPFGSTCSQWSVGSCKHSVFLSHPSYSQVLGTACNHTSCDACTADSRCGWCASTQTCSAGNATAPYAGTCQVIPFFIHISI